MFNSISSNRSPAASRMWRTLLSTAASVIFGMSTRPSALARVETLMISARRAATARMCGEPPPTRIGGGVVCLGRGAWRSSMKNLPANENGALVVSRPLTTSRYSSKRATRTRALSYDRPAWVDLVLGPASPNTKLEPAVGQQLNRGRFLGEDGRWPKVLVEDIGRQFD